MPLVELLGVPRMWGRTRRKLKNAIREAVSYIPEMGLTTDEVSVLTFREAGGFDKEIHIRTTFNEKEERDFEVRETLTREVAEVVKAFFPKTKLIESWGNPFSKSNGFFDIRRH